MKKVLVTGGTGFIGSNLIKALSKEKLKIFSLDDYSSGTRENEIENVTNKQKLSEKRSKFSPIGLLLTLISIENNLKIIELPVTFKQRIGYSKSQSNKKGKAILYGLRFIWLILTK